MRKLIRSYLDFVLRCFFMSVYILVYDLCYVLIIFFVFIEYKSKVNIGFLIYIFYYFLIFIVYLIYVVFFILLGKLGKFGFLGFKGLFGSFGVKGEDGELG